MRMFPVLDVINSLSTLPALVNPLNYYRSLPFCQHKSIPASNCVNRWVKRFLPRLRPWLRTQPRVDRDNTAQVADSFDISLYASEFGGVMLTRAEGMTLMPSSLLLLFQFRMAKICRCRNRNRRILAKGRCLVAGGRRQTSRLFWTRWGKLDDLFVQFALKILFTSLLFDAAFALGHSTWRIWIVTRRWEGSHSEKSIKFQGFCNRIRIWSFRPQFGRLSDGNVTSSRVYFFVIQLVLTIHLVS